MLSRTIKRNKTSSAPVQDFQNDLRHTATLNVAVWQIPGPGKQNKGGEDTYFMSDDGTTMGVFDGVGGWAREGVDPREYSYALATGCKHAVDVQFLNDPFEILQYAYDKAKDVTGSCTAVIAQIQGRQLNAIIFGDSGLRIVRDGNIVLATQEQQHSFNTPFQLGTASSDKPSYAQHVNFTLQDGDIVVLGTDGLYDNLFGDKIASIVKENHTEKAQDIARIVAQQALVVSKNYRAFTPFADNATKMGHYHEGGKQDDITVMVAKYNEMNAKL